MGANCVYYEGGKCAPPGIPSGHDCSWPSSNYRDCSMYKLVAVKAAGGSMQDQLRAAGALPPGATVVGGSGRRMTDVDIARITRSAGKKWWEFWK